MNKYMKTAIEELRVANQAIRKQYRYPCGLLRPSAAEGLKASGAQFFFESPDGQNADLYWQLGKLGWGHSFYNAPYHWGLNRNGVYLRYVEGDIYLSEKPF